jgi:iron(III) transport system substrate-binding protein
MVVLPSEDRMRSSHASPERSRKLKIFDFRFSIFNFRSSLRQSAIGYRLFKVQSSIGHSGSEFKVQSFCQLCWLALLCLLALGSLNASAALFSRSPEVIVYCAQDQTYAEPIFRDFQKETGIKVRAVYDNEAVKTVGLANRLLAERNHPQCDLFWGNEEMRTRQLAAQDVFRETNGWTAFGYRSRRVVINTNKVSFADAPRSLSDLTTQIWRGKVAMAYPQFGTTGAHLNALRQSWGDAAWEAWCKALVANKTLLVDGNSMVVKMVGGAEAVVGLTDSDDIADAQKEGLPVAALPINAETLLIPNTVGIVRNSSHGEAAQRLSDFLQRPAILERLIAAKALEDADLKSVSVPTLKLDWGRLLRDLESTTLKLNSIFLR